MYTEGFRRQISSKTAVKVVVKSIRPKKLIICFSGTARVTFNPTFNILLRHDSRDGFDFYDIMYLTPHHRTLNSFQ